MSPDEMKAITKRFLAAWGNGNLSVLDEVCAPNYTLGGEGNLQDLKSGIMEYRKAVPDLTTELGVIVAEGDWVAYRWTMRGTHLGEYQGLAPTGKPVIAHGMTMIRFENGKIIEDVFETSSSSFEAQVSETDIAHP